MDISVASNFERLIYDFFLERNTIGCASLFDHFPEHPIHLSNEIWTKKNKLFSSSKVNDAETQKIIEDFFYSHNYLLDPHTAIAVGQAIKKSDANNPYVVLSTAHPAKFPKVYKEMGIELINVPGALMGLYDKKEHLYAFDADYDQIINFIKQNNLET
jgi:threonine synthase